MVAVGIDVSKGSHELCILGMESSKQAPRLTVLNDAKGYEQALAWVRQLTGSEETTFCMESTGGYEFDFACFLAKAKERVCVENPRRIKHYALAKGMTNKTDRADAKAIASYTLAMNPRTWALADETRRELALLTRHREDLMGELNRYQNRLEKSQLLPKRMVQHLEQEMDLLQKQIKEVTEDLAQILASSEPLETEVKTLIKLRGFGFLTAVVVLSEMPDIDLFDTAESWASCAGLYPRRRQSGQWIGVSFMCRQGNAHVRRILYMGVTQAMKFHPGVKAMAERLKAKGKKPKQIRVACMRKMLLIAYGILKAIRQGRTPYYAEKPTNP